MLYTKSSFQFEDGGSEGTPPSGSWELYFDSAGGHIKSYEGVVSDLGGGGGGGLSGFQGLYQQLGREGAGGNLGKSILQPFSSAFSDTSIHIKPLGNGGFSIGETGLGITEYMGHYSVDLQIPTGSHGYAGSGNALGDFSAVVGGSGNHAAANYSIVGGGTLNSIDETVYDRSHSVYSFIGAGIQNHIKDSKVSAIVGGYGNQILGENTPVSGNYVIGNGNTMQDYSNTIMLGHNCSVGSDYSTAIGRNARASRHGEIAFGAGKFSLNGDAKTSILVSRNSTTDATQTDLYLDGSSRVIDIYANSAFYFETDIVAKQDQAGGGDCAAYKIQGLIKNHGGTTFVGSPTVTTIAEDDPTWSVTATAAGIEGNGTLQLKVTGAAATNIRWVATTKLTEVRYA